MRDVFVPAADEIRTLTRILPIHAEFLEYAILRILEDNPPGGIAYDGTLDAIIYHYKLDPLIDWTLFTAQEGDQEVWIIQRVGGEAA